MRITWKDAATTVSTGGAIVLERAYYHNYDWPLVSSIRWVVGGLAVLGFINLILGFAAEWGKNIGMDLLAMFFGVGLATLTVLGLVYSVSDYVVLTMLSTILIWAASLTYHFAEHTTPRALYHA